MLVLNIDDENNYKSVVEGCWVCDWSTRQT